MDFEIKEIVCNLSKVVHKHFGGLESIGDSCHCHYFSIQLRSLARCQLNQGADRKAHVFFSDYTFVEILPSLAELLVKSVTGQMSY